LPDLASSFRILLFGPWAGFAALTIAGTTEPLIFSADLGVVRTGLLLLLGQ
jgi:hypothetical protein